MGNCMRDGVFHMAESISCIHGRLSRPFGEYHCETARRTSHNELSYARSLGISVCLPDGFAR